MSRPGGGEEYEDEDFDYRDDDEGPHPRYSTTARPAQPNPSGSALADERKRQLERVQALLSKEATNRRFRRRWEDGDSEGDEEEDGQRDGNRRATVTPSHGEAGGARGLLSSLVKQVSTRTLLGKMASSSALLDIKTVPAADDSHRLLVRAVMSQRSLLPGSAASAPPPAQQASSSSTTTQFTLWVVGAPRSGRHSLVAGLLHYLKKKIGPRNVAAIVAHLQVKIQEDLPPMSQLASRSSILIVVYDVCERGALDNVSRLSSTPTHKPMLVGNKVDSEFWRVVQVSHAENVALLHGYDYLEASALTGLHVADVLNAIDGRLRLSKALRLLAAELPLEVDVGRLSDASSNSSLTRSSGDDEEEEEEVTAYSPTSTVTGPAILTHGEDYDDDGRRYEQALSTVDDSTLMMDAEQELSRVGSSASILGSRPVSTGRATSPLHDQLQPARAASPRLPSSQSRMSAPMAPPAAAGGGASLPGAAQLPAKAPVTEEERQPEHLQLRTEDVESLDVSLVSSYIQQQDEAVTAQPPPRGGAPQSMEIVHKYHRQDSQQQLSGSFFRRRTRRRLKLVVIRALLCCPCMALYGTGRVLGRWCRVLCAGTKLIDNVLADTENAFQTLAKVLFFLLPAVQTPLALFWAPVGALLSYMVTLVSCVTLILPSFFTLLIVRTTKTEIRYKAVILKEQAKESLVRWVRIVARSCPMTAFLLAVPLALVYWWLPTATSPDEQTAMLVAYLTCLGTVRSYYSWKAKELLIPEAPKPVQEEEDVEEATLLHRLGLRHRSPEKRLVTKMPSPPPVPGSFPLTKAANLAVLASLLLETVQMATYPLQFNPYAGHPSATTSRQGAGGLWGGRHLSSPGSSSSEGAGREFWGARAFSFLYLSALPHSQVTFIWAAVALVAGLVALLVAHVTRELHTYGKLLKAGDKDKARDSFFFSLTGSIVYGHGLPANVTPATRIVIATLTDTLFFLISIQLLHGISCDNHHPHPHPAATAGGASSLSPVLHADPTTVCWEGRHQPLAYACLLAYAFYVSLSIMIAPMLMEKPAGSLTAKARRGQGAEAADVSFVKLHLMVVNVIKSALLVVGALGPRSLLSTVVVTTVSSALLCLVTLTWFIHYSPAHYSQELQPCNVAMINVWKAASYSAGASTALVVLAANLLGPSFFPEATLLPALVITWLGLGLGFVAYYLRWRCITHQRYATIKALIDMPFRYHASVITSDVTCDGDNDEDDESEGKRKRKVEADKRDQQGLAVVGDYDRLNQQGPPPAIPGYDCCPLCQHRRSAQGLIFGGCGAMM